MQLCYYGFNHEGFTFQYIYSNSVVYVYTYTVCMCKCITNFYTAFFPLSQYQCACHNDINFVERKKDNHKNVTTIIMDQ